MTTITSVERRVARVLLWGGLLSVMLAASGLAFDAASGHSRLSQVVHILQQDGRNRPAGVFTSLQDVHRGLAARPPDPLAVTSLGLLGLLATPVVGVAVAIPAFWREGDRRYALIAGAVLAMLLVSFVLAAT